MSYQQGSERQVRGDLIEKEKVDYSGRFSGFNGSVRAVFCGEHQSCPCPQKVERGDDFHRYT